jgi:uncharacterized membrane protein HdeD (DUF308 family)
MSNRLGGLWLGYLLRGLLALALGFGALFWPSATVELLVRLVGIFAILNGSAGLFSAYQARMPGSYWIPGWLNLGVGAILLFWPGVTVRLLFFILGIWAVFQGGSLWLMARQAAADDPDRGLLSGVGVVAVLIGLLLIFWPATGAVAISWVIAALALLAGFMLVYMALHLHRARQGISHMR